jgi:peptidyl-prolyl cis-trans isomerase SurA
MSIIVVYGQGIPPLSQGDVIDKVIAIVGKDIILKSDIDAVLLEEINRSGKYDINDKELRKKILDKYIEEKLLVTKAEEDSVVISDELIEERFEMAIQNLLSYYGSIERIEALSNKSIVRIKTEFRDEIRKQLMTEELQRKKFSNINVNTKEISEFYEEYKDSLPMMPEQVELYHIFKTIGPNLESKENTFALAKMIRDSIIKGADFSELAKEYSEDIGSKDADGDLGWVERGKFVGEFERAAIALQKGEISMPVESPFGYHIIKLVDKNKDSIHAQHILFKLLQSDDDMLKTKAFLDSLRQDALKRDNFEDLARKFSDDLTTKGFGGYIGKLYINAAEYADILSSLKDGEISEPLPFAIDPTKQGLRVVFRKKTISEHLPNLTEDYDFLKSYSIRYKTIKLQEKWIDELKKQIYWEVFE